MADMCLILLRYNIFIQRIIYNGINHVPIDIVQSGSRSLGKLIYVSLKNLQYMFNVP